MIHFKCHRCKRKIAVPEGFVGRKVKCPACSIVTIVPDIPGAKEAKAREAVPKVTPPPLPQAPPPLPDPLDLLAAAASGEVIDEGYDPYDQPHGYDEPAMRPEPRVRSRRGMSTLAIFFILLIIGAALGAGVGHLVYYLNESGVNRQSSTITYGSKAHLLAILYGVLGGAVAAGLLAWIIGAARSAGVPIRRR